MPQLQTVVCHFCQKQVHDRMVVTAFTMSRLESRLESVAQLSMTPLPNRVQRP